MSDIAPISTSGTNFAGAARLDGHPAAPALRNGAIQSSQATPGDASRVVDEVAISEHAMLMSRIRQLPEVRQNLVDRVRAELSDNPDAFITPEKIAVAAHRLGEEIDLFG